jgi:hypothetical protein
MAVLAGCITTIAMLKEENAVSLLQATGFDFFAIDHLGEIYQHPHNSNPSKED